MRREMHTAHEIRAEVYRRLNELRRTPLTVPLPYPVAPTPDNLNANWDMPRDFRGLVGYQIEIGLVLLAMKKRWDLDAR
jgi:hypothetical protein